MNRPSARFVALVGFAVLIGSCRKTDSPTEPTGPVTFGIPVNPVLVPSPANEGAAPVNQIEVTVLTLPDSTQLGTITATATPGSDNWDVQVSGSTEATSLQVAVYVSLINVSGSGQAVQFSGVLSPVTISPSGTISPLQVTLVRGPLANVFATGVSIDAAPDSIDLATTSAIVASATTSGSEPPTVFWTVTDTAVLTATDSTVTGASLGTTQLIASAGRFSDTTSVTVKAPLVPTDLAIGKSLLPGASFEGDTVTFELVVGNSSSEDLLAVPAVDTLPVGLEPAPVPANATWDANGRELSWTVDSLLSSEADTLLLRAEVQAGTAGSDLTNVAHVGIPAGYDDPDLTNNVDSVTLSVPLSNLPVVTVTAPQDSAVFDPGEIVAFAATASDVEDGVLTDSITWTSSLDGAIGSGGSFQTTQLSTGVHEVVANVVDSDGGVAADTLTVTVALYSVPVTLNVPFSSTAQMPITLAEPAPVGGLTLTLSSDDESITGATTSSVFIPEGALSANATLEGRIPGQTSFRASSAQFGVVSSLVSVTAEFNIVQSSVTVPGGFGQPIEIRFESQGSPIAAPPGGTSVTLTSLNPQCVAVPAQATIPAGLTSQVDSVTYGGSATLPCDTYVRASAPTITSDSVRVFVQAMPGFSVTDEELGSGLMIQDAAFLAASQHGGVTVQVKTLDPALALVSPNASTVGSDSIDVVILPGFTRVDYVLHGLEGVVDDTAQVVLSAPGFTTDTIAVAVVQGGYDIAGLGTTGTTFTTPDAFTVRTGILNSQQTGLTQVQSVRAGGTALTTTVTSSAPSVGDLLTLPDSASPVTMTIAPGAGSTPSSVAAGGVALTRVGGGVTTVSAAIPGLIASNNASFDVTISTPAISVGDEVVGSGLMLSDAAFLGATQHGGVTVQVKTLDPTLALLSASTSSAGTDSIDVVVGNGANRVNYVLHGLEGIVNDTAQVVISAPGFTTDTINVAVVQAGYDISGLATSGTTFTADDAFTVRVGLMNGTQTGLIQLQAVRTGGTPLTATVSSSAPAVGELVTLPDSASPITMTIGPGASSTPGSVGTGGVALTREGGGVTTVAASIPGLVATGNASFDVTIATPVISVGDERLGSGLMKSDAAFLGATQHGGVTVTLKSLDPAIALLSQNVSTVGTDSIDIVLANGASRVDFVLHGIEAILADTAQVEVSAPGFTTDTIAVSVERAGYDIAGLGTTKNSFSPDDVFQVRVGILNAPQTGLQQVQSVRAGASPLDVTVTSSAPSVGLIAGVDSTASVVSAAIVEGAGSTPTQVVSGGMAFDTRGFGTSTVSAAISVAGNTLTASTNASINVDVTAPSISVSDRTLGSGLMLAVASFLGASDHGGVTVRVTSSNPSVFTVSTGPTIQGTDFADVFVPNGQTRLNYYIHGIEGITNPTSPSITLSAPGFTNGVATVTVVQPAIDISALGTITTAAGADDPFSVRIGIPNGTNTALTQLQAVRAGATDLTATVTSSDAGLGQLVTTVLTGATVSVVIPVGASSSSGSVATGGVAFDPIAAGVVNVSATVPGVVLTGAATRTVTINP